jgi:hypothetical protein
MKHTPGPWNYQATAGDHDFAVYGLDGRDIALVRNFHKANAQLIAAAPDLLAALRALECILDGRQPIDVRGAVMVIRHALAKVTR